MLPTAAHEVNESIREIDCDSWLIANKLLLSRQRSPQLGKASWSDSKGAFFTISTAPSPIPDSRPLSETSELQKVYDAGGVSAVWRIGEAFLKVKKLIIHDATREHTTLAYIHERGPLFFDIPDVHYHLEIDDRYYIVLSRLPGPTLAEAWFEMDETTKQTYVNQVASICQQMAAWEARSISGVDGRHLSDVFFSKLGTEPKCDSQSMLQSCLDLGMECSSFVFYHCDLGPANIIIGPSGKLGILDWETAGFVPIEWIRTKFCFSSGMDLPVQDDDIRPDWRRRVSRRLGTLGYIEIVDDWFKWWNDELNDQNA